MQNRLAAVITVVAIATSAYAQTPTPSGYLLPPKVIVDMLDAPPPPTAEVSPARDVIALLERASMPTIAELSQPFYRLAGVRINPRTNAPHRGQRYRNLTLKVIADSSERKVTLPPSPVIEWIGFSADGKRFAFTNMRENGVELWIGDTATGQAKSITPAQLNSVFGEPCSFIGDGNSLLCAFINSNRGPAPQAPAAPTGPNIQESRGVVASVPTVQDMYDRTIPVYTLSKSYAITGVRVGYFAIKDQALRDRALKIILYTTSNVSSIAQYGALGAMTYMPL